MTETQSIFAVIPARKGSKRIHNKNIKLLGNHPLIAYTIEAAKRSGIFKGIYVSTDSNAIGYIADYYGATCFKRPAQYARDNSPDIQWLKNLNKQRCGPEQKLLRSIFGEYDYFAILRPTNPFRTPEMIYHAWQNYERGTWLKAIEPCGQHPHKMFVATENNHIQPFDEDSSKPNLHALPTQSLNPVFVQNGSLEIRPINDLEPEILTGYVTQGYDGFDINTEKDWVYAEWLIDTGKVKLIDIDKESICSKLPSILFS